MTAPSLAEANAFVAVLERRSFSKAAKQLNLSPARVSEMVRRLEEQLGVRLIERTTRSVAATAAGELLVARLRPVLDDYLAALESTNEFRTKPAGTVRLTVAPIAADIALAPVIARFFALYPDINLDISVDSALTDIVAGRFDAGIRPGERLARDMIALRVSDGMEWAIAASPAYLARRGQPRTPQDLAAHDCVRVRLATGAILPWRVGRKRSTLEVQVGSRLIVNEFSVALTAAVAGVGLIQVPRAYAASELAAGQLVTVLDSCAAPPGEGLFLYYPSRRQIRAPLKALVDFLRAERHGTA